MNYKQYQPGVFAFADGLRQYKIVQIGSIGKLIVVHLENEPIFHFVFYILHEAKHPVKRVKRVLAFKFLVFGEAIDEGMINVGPYAEILNVEITIEICVDGKDLFASLATQGPSIDRSTCRDVGTIRFQLHVRIRNENTWIPV